MSAGSIAVKQNTDNSLKLHFSNADGTDIDITGWTVYFTVKAEIQGQPAFPEITITDHSDPAHGITYVPLSAAELAIEPGTYYYGIHPVDADGAARDSGLGMFIVEPVAKD